MPDMLSKAIRIAAIAHEGQYDKAKNSYIIHPLHVCFSVGSNVFLQTAAVLHDIIEETEWTLEELKEEGFHPSVIDAIDAVTRRIKSDGTKELYHKEYIPRIKKSKFGTIIKMKDLEHNSSTQRLVHLPMETMQSFIKKYGKAKLALWETYVDACLEIYGFVL